MAGMRLLEDIEEAKRVAGAALAAADELTRRAEALDRTAADLAKAIAEAPKPRVYTVKLQDAEREISERDGLVFCCAAFVALASLETVDLPTLQGDILTIAAGDADQIARQILAQASAP